MTWFSRVFLFIILFFRFCYYSKLAHMSFYKSCRIQFSMPKNNIRHEALKGIHCRTRRKKLINSHFICNNIQISATFILPFLYIKYCQYIIKLMDPHLLGKGYVLLVFFKKIIKIYFKTIIDTVFISLIKYFFYIFGLKTIIILILLVIILV